MTAIKLAVKLSHGSLLAEAHGLVYLAQTMRDAADKMEELHFQVMDLEIQVMDLEIQVMDLENENRSLKQAVED